MVFHVVVGGLMPLLVRRCSSVVRTLVKNMPTWMSGWQRGDSSTPMLRTIFRFPRMAFLRLSPKEEGVTIDKLSLAFWKIGNVHVQPLQFIPCLLIIRGWHYSDSCLNGWQLTISFRMCGRQWTNITGAERREVTQRPVCFCGVYVETGEIETKLKIRYFTIGSDWISRNVFGCLKQDCYK